MLTKRRLMQTAGAAVAGMGLAGCGGPGGGVAHLRFKVIARARLDGKDYEGFAVNEMKASYTPNSLTRMMMGRTLKMEATVVDFGGKADALFILLQDYLVIIGLLWGIPVAGDADETTIGLLRAASGAREYPRKNPGIRTLDQSYPKIAAFRDEADPASVYEVDPDNLAKTHGSGAKFLGLSIEIVDPKTPLTEAIEHRLSWLGNFENETLREPSKWPEDLSAPLGQRIIGRDFKEGE
ncbi:MAG: hypothetical protein A3E78_05160 [Alphaproteobacteria bacterium RIFCSPHIGHO2_12_FULL_63_12]|nr:MAG: hypothetical protein A3E78_05160 [Alphaproteobacteria bacterium RIFCSPHIGHO2_12_FULL_63_12]